MRSRRIRQPIRHAAIGNAETEHGTARNRPVGRDGELVVGLAEAGLYAVHSDLGDGERVQIEREAVEPPLRFDQDGRFAVELPRTRGYVEVEIIVNGVDAVIAEGRKERIDGESRAGAQRQRQRHPTEPVEAKHDTLRYSREENLTSLDANGKGIPIRLNFL